jgi:hypothetical protein
MVPKVAIVSASEVAEACDTDSSHAAAKVDDWHDLHTEYGGGSSPDRRRGVPDGGAQARQCRLAGSGSGGASRGSGAMNEGTRASCE